MLDRTLESEDICIKELSVSQNPFNVINPKARFNLKTSVYSVQFLLTSIANAGKWKMEIEETHVQI